MSLSEHVQRRADGYPVSSESALRVQSILNGKLPSCISEHQFTEDGFIIGERGKKLVPLYVSGIGVQNKAERPILQMLADLGFHVLSTEQAISEYPDALSSHDEYVVAHTLANDVLMPRSKAMLILMDDDNVLNEQRLDEVTNMATQQGPVVGINMGTGRPSSIDYLKTFMSEGYGGAYFEGKDAKFTGLYHLARFREELLHPSSVGEVSHRTSNLRRLQTALADYIPRWLAQNDAKGRFPGTKIHDTIARGEALNADDITLSQLQMTAYICKMLDGQVPLTNFPLEYLLTSMLNGADGPIARKMGTVSKEGGIKDASVDRLTEIMLARLIARQTGMTPEMHERLQVSFQLSTLTKAASEMSGVKTKEGGPGGMIKRRMTLFLILDDIIKMRKLQEDQHTKKSAILNRINARLEGLINNSVKKAQERIEGIIAQGVGVIEAPVNPASSGASEARKYAGIVHINDMLGIDIVTELNRLSGGRLIFPTVDSLIRKDEYIERSLGRAHEFITEALHIAQQASHIP